MLSNLITSAHWKRMRNEASEIDKLNTKRSKSRLFDGNFCNN